MSSSTAKKIIPVATLLCLIVLWELLCRTGLVPSFLLPAPSAVLCALVLDAPLIASHALTTLVEALLGLAIGILLGFVLALLMDRFEYVAFAISPLMTLSQTVPSIAIAPLLVLWFGYGILPKLILVVITSFFPVAVALYSGLSSVDPDLIDLMRSLKASEWQIFVRVKLPAAAEQFFSGLRIAAAYAIVSAVIAEWLGGFSGLGVYMTRVRKSFSYDKMFASILLISLLSLALMRAVDALEYVLLPWKRKERTNE